jgi:hypothetical protein
MSIQKTIDKFWLESKAIDRMEETLARLKNVKELGL